MADPHGHGYPDETCGCSCHRTGKADHIAPCCGFQPPAAAAPSESETKQGEIECLVFPLTEGWHRCVTNDYPEAACPNVKRTKPPAAAPMKDCGHIGCIGNVCWCHERTLCNHPEPPAAAPEADPFLILGPGHSGKPCGFVPPVTCKHVWPDGTACDGSTQEHLEKRFDHPFQWTDKPIRLEDLDLKVNPEFDKALKEAVERDRARRFAADAEDVRVCVRCYHSYFVQSGRCVVNACCRECIPQRHYEIREMERRIQAYFQKEIAAQHGIRESWTREIYMGLIEAIRDKK